MEVPAIEGDQDKSDQDSDEQDGSDGDNPAPPPAPPLSGNPPTSTRAARSSISGSSKVHWTQQEDELLREGEETAVQLCSAVLWSYLISFVSPFLILDSGATARHQVDRPRPWQDALSVQASVHPTQSECHQRRVDSHGTYKTQVFLDMMISGVMYKTNYWQDDRDLEQLVAKYGTKNWSFIALQIVGRTGKQCRER